MREDLTGKIYADGNVTVLGLKEIKKIGMLFIIVDVKNVVILLQLMIII